MEEDRCPKWNLGKETVDEGSRWEGMSLYCDTVSLHATLFGCLKISASVCARLTEHKILLEKVSKGNVYDPGCLKRVTLIVSLSSRDAAIN